MYLRLKIILEVLPVCRKLKHFPINIFQKKFVTPFGFSYFESSKPQRIKFPMFSFVLSSNIPYEYKVIWLKFLSLSFLSNKTFILS